MDSKDSKGCLFVGEGVTINGEVSLPGAVFVDGVINGQIKANEVFVGITGQVNGTVSASKADVRGAVGDAIEIHEHITVRASARLQGNVTYRSLEIERGGVIEGQLVCADRLRVRLRRGRSGPDRGRGDAAARETGSRGRGDHACSLARCTRVDTPSGC